MVGGYQRGNHCSVGKFILQYTSSTLLLYVSNSYFITKQGNIHLMFFGYMWKKIMHDLKAQCCQQITSSNSLISEVFLSIQWTHLALLLSWPAYLFISFRSQPNELNKPTDVWYSIIMVTYLVKKLSKRGLSWTSSHGYHDNSISSFNRRKIIRTYISI